MLRRAVTFLAVTGVLLATAATPAAAATVACRPGAGSPACVVWTGKVSWVPDGDTPLVDVYGDGTAEPLSIRLIGVQAMEQSVYNPVVSKRRGECHALAATARVEQLVKAGGGIVRLTAQHASSHSDVRNRPFRSIAVKINGGWRDIGLDLIRNGYALWLPIPGEEAWNQQYRVAAQQAARAGKQMYDTDVCGSGPAQAAKLSMNVDWDKELMTITNHSAGPVSLAGWWVRDSASRRYTFPSGAVVRAGQAIYVHVGKGTATATHRYWGLPGPAFANPTFDSRAMGDGGYLFDPRGDLRAHDLYPCVVACQ